jgi:hypothetical protein
MWPEVASAHNSALLLGHLLPSCLAWSALFAPSPFPPLAGAALAAALDQALAAWPWARSPRPVPNPQDLVHAVRRFRPLGRAE